jgi:hypothetical protein
MRTPHSHASSATSAPVIAHVSRPKADASTTKARVTESDSIHRKKKKDKKKRDAIDDIFGF